MACVCHSLSCLPPVGVWKVFSEGSSGANPSVNPCNTCSVSSEAGNKPIETGQFEWRWQDTSTSTTVQERDAGALYGQTAWYSWGIHNWVPCCWHQIAQNIALAWSTRECPVCVYCAPLVLSNPPSQPGLLPSKMHIAGLLSYSGHWTTWNPTGWELQTWGQNSLASSMDQGTALPFVLDEWCGYTHLPSLWGMSLLCSLNLSH